MSAIYNYTYIYSQGRQKALRRQSIAGTNGLPSNALSLQSLLTPITSSLIIYNHQSIIL